MTEKAAAARRTALSQAMKREGAELLLVFGNNWHSDYLRYAVDFGIQEGQGVAFVHPDGSAELILDDAAECERARTEGLSCEISFAPALVREARSRAGRAGNRNVVAAPFHLLPYGLLHADGDRRITNGAAVIERLLMTRLDAEIEAVRNAATLADEGYSIFRAAARPGRKDYELVAEVEAFFRARGVPENFMIIGVGGREVRGMAPPGGKVLKAGDMVTTELTPCHEGYFAQICRTLVVGDASDAQRRAFDLFLESMLAGVAAVAAGTPASAVAKAENDVFRKHGLADYTTSEYTRVRGHGVGLFPDQKPPILEDVETPLEAGMTIIVHPNTYHPEVGYMVLGDTLLVKEGGAEPLSVTPRELFVVR